jgi:hypothetical protein
MAHRGYAASVRRCKAAILACAAAQLLAACGPTHRPGDAGGASAPAAPGIRWPFEPVSIRVHPLSRIAVEPDGARKVELLIECRDAEGDSVRSVGTLWVRLGDAARPELEHDLGNPEVNQQDWDRVTRTYRRSMPLPASLRCDAGTMLDVAVELNLGDGRVLKAAEKLPCP